LFELRQQRAHEHFGFALGSVDFFNQRNFSTAVAVDFAEAFDGATLLTLDENLYGAVRQLQKL
jgi:hypothetical protein